MNLRCCPDARSTPSVDSGRRERRGPRRRLRHWRSWTEPDGGVRRQWACGRPSLLVGSDPDGQHELPWDLIEGSVEDLAAPDAVAVDTTYFAELGVDAIGDRAEINNTQVTVKAVTKGIRSFTTLPYIFTTLTCARTLVDAAPEQSSYYLVRVAPGSNVEDVRKAAADAPARRRGPHPRRIPQAQPRLLAVRDRRRLGADRRRRARHHCRRRRGRPDALRQHQGAPQRVRHACARSAPRPGSSAR